MRFAWLLRFLLLFFAVFALNAQALPWKKTEAVKAELISQATSVQPGSSIRLGVLLTKSPAGTLIGKRPVTPGFRLPLTGRFPRLESRPDSMANAESLCRRRSHQLRIRRLCSSARFNFRSRICQGRRLRRKSECLLVSVRGTMHSGKRFVRRSR